MPVNSFSATDFDRHLGQREHEGQHGEAERDRDRHAGQSSATISSTKIDDDAQALRHRTIKCRRHGATAASPRSGPAASDAGSRPSGLRIAVARRLRRMRRRRAAGIDSVRDRLDAFDLALVVMRQFAGAVERPARPAGSGSTSGRSRAGSPDRRSTSALRDRSTAGRSAYIWQTKRRRTTPTMPVNSAPHSRPNRITLLARAVAAAC